MPGDHADAGGAAARAPNTYGAHGADRSGAVDHSVRRHSTLLVARARPTLRNQADADLVACGHRPTVRLVARPDRVSHPLHAVARCLSIAGRPVRTEEGVAAVALADLLAERGLACSFVRDKPARSAACAQGAAQILRHALADLRGGDRRAIPLAGVGRTAAPEGRGPADQNHQTRTNRLRELAHEHLP